MALVCPVSVVALRFVEGALVPEAGVPAHPARLNSAPRSSVLRFICPSPSLLHLPAGPHRRTPAEWLQGRQRSGELPSLAGRIATPGRGAAARVVPRSLRRRYW